MGEPGTCLSVVPGDTEPTGKYCCKKRGPDAGFLSGLALPSAPGQGSLRLSRYLKSSFWVGVDMSTHRSGCCWMPKPPCPGHQGMSQGSKYMRVRRAEHCVSVPLLLWGGTMCQPFVREDRHPWVLFVPGEVTEQVTEHPLTPPTRPQKPTAALFPVKSR